MKLGIIIPKIETIIAFKLSSRDVVRLGWIDHIRKHQNIAKTSRRFGVDRASLSRIPATQKSRLALFK